MDTIDTVHTRKHYGLFLRFSYTEEVAGSPVKSTGQGVLFRPLRSPQKGAFPFLLVVVVGHLALVAATCA
jgi:hypothetical protein